MDLIDLALEKGLNQKELLLMVVESITQLAQTVKMGKIDLPSGLTSNQKIAQEDIGAEFAMQKEMRSSSALAS